MDVMHAVQTMYASALGRLRANWRERTLAIVLVLALHVAAIWGILQAFGGVAVVLNDVGAGAVLQAFDVPLEKPGPSPSPAAPEPAGASAAEGKRAKAAQDIAKARVPAKKMPAPPVASTGSDTRSGAAAAGAGTGGGGSGSGTGSGASGSGSGGGLARGAEKIAGDIRSTRDYPAASRDARIGRSVVLLLTVGTDGRVTGCRIYRPSGVPEADAITCRLAMERFRFRPATGPDGRPVVSTYGWQQSWFAP